MGRYQVNPIRKYFTFEPASNKSLCQIVGCEARIAGNHGGNLQRHIEKKHPAVYRELLGQPGLKRHTAGVGGHTALHSVHFAYQRIKNTIKMTSTQISQAGGSSLGEALDKRPFSGPPESTPGARPFSGPLCASLDDVFGDSASGFSRSRVTTATFVQHEKPRWMADLFGEIMGEAAAIKGIPMPAPPLVPVSDDMQGECFRTPSSSRRVTQCPLFPPVQHLFTAAGGDPSTLKAPVKSFTDFTNVEGWADTQARGIPRLEPPLAALLCPGAEWRPNENDRLHRQIVGLTDRVFVFASQSAAAVNNLALPLPWSPCRLVGRPTARRKPRDG
ncbi:unnamed protein product [Boreogadus saida]